MKKSKILGALRTGEGDLLILTNERVRDEAPWVCVFCKPSGVFEKLSDSDEFNYLEELGLPSVEIEDLPEFNFDVEFGFETEREEKEDDFDEINYLHYVRVFSPEGVLYENWLGSDYGYWEQYSKESWELENPQTQTSARSLEKESADVSRELRLPKIHFVKAVILSDKRLYISLLGRDKKQLCEPKYARKFISCYKKHEYLERTIHHALCDMGKLVKYSDHKPVEQKRFFARGVEYCLQSLKVVYTASEVDGRKESKRYFYECPFCKGVHSAKTKRAKRKEVRDTQSQTMLRNAMKSYLHSEHFAEPIIVFEKSFGFDIDSKPYGADYQYVTDPHIFAKEIVNRSKQKMFFAKGFQEPVIEPVLNCEVYTARITCAKKGSPMIFFSICVPTNEVVSEMRYDGVMYEKISTFPEWRVMPEWKVAKK